MRKSVSPSTTDCTLRRGAVAARSAECGMWASQEEDDEKCLTSAKLCLETVLAWLSCSTSMRTRTGRADEVACAAGVFGALFRIGLERGLKGPA